MSRRYIHRPVSRLSTTLASLAAVVALGASLAACSGASAVHSSGTPHPHEAGTSPTVAPVTATSDAARAQQSAQILAAWTAAEDAVETAALTDDPYEPALEATTVSPALPKRQAFMVTMQMAGDVARGKDNHGHPVVSSVTGNVAMVRTCESGDEIAVSVATGKPAPGEIGAIDDVLVTSTMVLTSDGWKLSDETDQPRMCRA
jgi:hypothetical protein